MWGLVLALGLIAIPEAEVVIAAQVIGDGAPDEPDALSLGAEAARAVGFVRGLAPAEERRELEATLLACGPDERCLAKKLRGGLALLVLLDARAPGLLSLQLVDGGNGKVVERAAIEIDAAKAIARVQPAVIALLGRTGRVIDGRVLVEVTPHEASLELGGAEIAAGKSTRAAPGNHLLRATAAGWLAQELAVEVRPGEEARPSIHLEREPSSFLSSPILWIAIGAATIAGGAAVIAAASGRTPVFCHEHDAASCP